MSESASPHNTPRIQRFSLVNEAANALRKAIRNGTWEEYLPGERSLCAQWQISRPTLRAALNVLHREKVIAINQGKRTRILEKGAKAGAQVFTVGLLSPETMEAMPPFVLVWVDELRGQLAAAGHFLHVQVGGAAFSKSKPENALAALVDSVPAAAWILYQTTETMQRWFMERNIPCMVVGSLMDGVDLPSVDRDYRAVCRHAVGVLTNRGHRKIALLIQNQRFGGDRESEQGFQEGLNAATARGVMGMVARHDSTRRGIMVRLDELLAARPRPTALLVARSAHALTALTYLLQRGVRVPQDMAILCRDEDSFLEHTAPPVARYTVSPASFANRVFRLVLHLVQDGHVKAEAVRIMPQFAPRESLNEAKAR